MNVVWGNRAFVEAFVMNIAGIPRGFGPCQTAQVARDDGEMVAGVVVHNWCPETEVAEISCAAIDPRWFQRNVMQEVFRYTFDQMGCQMVVFRVAEDNRRTRRLIRALGAVEYLIPRLRGRTASEALLTLTDDAWKASKFA